MQPAFVDVDSVTQDTRRFRCGKPQMDAFLIRYAVKNAELGISKTWVLLDGDKGEKKKFPVAAYYTLAVGTVTRETLPVDHKELPSYPVPVTLLARLAVSENYQNRGVGGKALVTALRQAVILKDKGLPSVQSHGRGDEIVHVNVWTPKKLNDEEKRLLEKLREMPNLQPQPGKDDRGFFDRMKDYFK